MLCTSQPLRLDAEQLDVAGARVRLDVQRYVARHDNLELARAEFGVHVGLRSERDRHSRQIDDEMARAEPVRMLNRGDRRRRVDLFAEATAQRHVERGGRAA